MRRHLFPLVLFALSACGGSTRLPARTLGVGDHLAEADRHDAEAREHDELAAGAERRATVAPLVCGDRALADLATSGGEVLVLSAPCWTSEAHAVENHRAAAARLRADAADHRARARKLLTRERGACAGLPAAEIDHSPFDHRGDIGAVAAEVDGDRLVGARVTFEAVPGLSAAWLRRALACHQAQAATSGHDGQFLPTSPSVVAGAETTVLDEPGGLVVVIRAGDPAAALVVYARAEALLASGVDAAATSPR